MPATIVYDRWIQRVLSADGQRMLDVEVTEDRQGVFLAELYWTLKHGAYGIATQLDDGRFIVDLSNVQEVPSPDQQPRSDR